MRTRRPFLILLVLVAASWPCWDARPAAAQTPAEVLVTMPDGVRLATDIYLPIGHGWGPWPVILQRTPYGKQSALSASTCLAWLAQGFVCVAQDVRGTGRSEGQNTVFRDDRVDGQTTIEWITRQVWSNDKIGTFGGSALGITEYALAPGAPSALSAASRGGNSRLLPPRCVRWRRAPLRAHLPLARGAERAWLFRAAPPAPAVDLVAGDRHRLASRHDRRSRATRWRLVRHLPPRHVGRVPPHPAPGRPQRQGETEARRRPVDAYSGSAAPGLGSSPTHPTPCPMASCWGLARLVPPPSQGRQASGRELAPCVSTSWVRWTNRALPVTDGSISTIGRHLPGRCRFSRVPVEASSRLLPASGECPLTSDPANPVPTRGGANLFETVDGAYLGIGPEDQRRSRDAPMSSSSPRRAARAAAGHRAVASGAVRCAPIHPTRHSRCGSPTSTRTGARCWSWTDRPRPHALRRRPGVFADTGTGSGGRGRSHLHGAGAQRRPPAARVGERLELASFRGQPQRRQRFNTPRHGLDAHPVLLVGPAYPSRLEVPVLRTSVFPRRRLSRG